MREALAASCNIVAVTLHQRLGLKPTINMARRLGITTALPENLSLALGTSEVSPFELLQAYLPMANGGKAVPLHTVQRIYNTEGKMIWERKPRPRQVIDERLAFLITSVLQDATGPTVRAASVQATCSGPSPGKPAPPRATGMPGLSVSPPIWPPSSTWGMTKIHRFPPAVVPWPHHCGPLLCRKPWRPLPSGISPFLPGSSPAGSAGKPASWPQPIVRARTNISLRFRTDGVLRPPPQNPAAGLSKPPLPNPNCPRVKRKPCWRPPGRHL